MAVGKQSRGEGLRVRLARLPQTPRGLLGQPLYLPAVLTGFAWSEPFSHSDYDTISDGQLSQPAMGAATARSLRTVDDVQTLTMDWEPSWFVERGLDPDEVRSDLTAIGRSRQPVELLVSRRLDEAPLLRMNITLRAMRFEVKGGEADTLYLTLTIEEWRRDSAGRAAEGHPTRAGKLPTSRKLEADDTLQSLAQLYYHSAALWRVIATANHITSWGQATPLVRSRRFKVGDKIVIPRQPPTGGLSAGVAWAEQHGVAVAA